MTKREPRKRQSMSQNDRTEALENTTKIARQAREDERARHADKTKRLRQERLEKGQQKDETATRSIREMTTEERRWKRLLKPEVMETRRWNGHASG